MRLELEAVKDRRIVAGGNHHAANGAPVFHGKRYRRRRGRVGGQNDLEVVARENLSGPSAELVGEKPSVIADDDFFLCADHRICAPVVGRGLSDTLDIGERKILSNNGPPAVGSELDLHRA